MYYLLYNTFIFLGLVLVLFSCYHLASTSNSKIAIIVIEVLATVTVGYLATVSISSDAVRYYSEARQPDAMLLSKLLYIVYSAAAILTTFSYSSYERDDRYKALMLVATIIIIFNTGIWWISIG